MGKWLRTSECVQFAVAEGVARITLNRPDKRNALSAQLLQELEAALLEADDRTDVNVIVLSGAGRDFCAGYDLSSAYGGIVNGAAEAGDGTTYRSANNTFDDDCWGMERNQNRFLTIMDIHKPVIAKVQGNCLAGGADLALLCDLIIASDDARIGYPATRANGTPPINLWFHLLGPQWAKRMLLTGDCISGRDAARIGLVLDSVPVGELDAEVDEIARKMSHIDAELLSVNKRAINLAFELAGGRTLQRLVTELDARGHLAQGPRRAQFRRDMAELGVKDAVKNRDALFGTGMIKLRYLEER